MIGKNQKPQPVLPLDSHACNYWSEFGFDLVNNSITPLTEGFNRKEIVCIY